MTNISTPPTLIERLPLILEAVSYCLLPVAAVLLLWIALLLLHEKSPEWASEKEYLHKKKEQLKTIALICLVVGIVGPWLAAYLANLTASVTN